MAEGSPNPMQAHLGLITSPGSFSPVGIPTPMIAPPEVKHPGEVSQNVVQQTQTQALYTMNAGGGGRPPAAPPSFAATATNNYASQYQANMAAINGQMFGSPFYAQMVSRMSGAPGFNSSMMPSATQFTDPSMGIFRPFPQGPTPMIPPVPQLPVFRHPLVPSAPAPRFQTPYEYVYNYQQMTADQVGSSALAIPGVGARLGAAYGGSLLGAGAGAALGGMFGGPLGARIGSSIGALGGMALSEYGGFGTAAQHMVNNLNPARAMAMRGAQMQGMSADWVVGGPGLGPTGSGWSRSSSIQAGRLVEDLAYDSSFRQQTHKAYSVQDVTRIAHLSGQNGLLDFSQSPEQVRDEVKKIATHLRVFMQVANEPSVREALKQLGQMRTMGLGIGDATNVAMNARMFARMAGTSIAGLTETAGLPGAMLFQQNGLTAGLGLHVGQGMYGLARGAVAGGAYSTQDLAMLGGAQGIGQRSTESALATLKMPMLAAAMSTYRNGSWGLNAGGIQKLLGGQVGIEEMARMGVSNINEAGVGGMGMFLMQQPALQDGLGRALGPIGLKQIQARTVMSAQRQLGFDQSPDGLYKAAKSTGMSDLEATQFVKESNNPAHGANMRGQLEVQIRESRAMERDRLETEHGNVFSRSARQSDGMLYGADRALHGLSTGFRDTLERAGQFFGELGEDSMLPGGVYSLRRNRDLMPSSSRQMRRLLDGISEKTLGPLGTESPGAPMFTAGGHQFFVSKGYQAFRDQSLGGDADVYKEYLTRKGGLGANAPVWAHRLFGQTVTAAQAHASLDDAGVGADAVRSGRNMTSADLNDGESRAAQTLGISKDQWRQYAGAAGGALAKKAASKYGSILHRKGSLSGSDFEEAIRSSGMPSDIAEKVIQDKSLWGGISSLGEHAASFNAREVFNASNTDINDKDSFLMNERAATDLVNRSTRHLFGEGDDSENRRIFRAGTGVDPRVFATAALLAGQAQGTSDKFTTYKASLGNEGNDIVSRAKDFLADNGGEGNTHLGAMAKRLSGLPTNLITANVQDLVGRGERGVQSTAIREGIALSHLPKDIKTMLNDVVDGKRSAASVMSRLKRTDDPTYRDIGEHGTPTDLLKQLARTGLSSDERQTGGDGGRVEAGAARKISRSAAIDEELSHSFPRAVDVFEEASRKMLLVAETLGAARPTRYGSNEDF